MYNGSGVATGRIGELLLEDRVITAEQLRLALDEQKANGRRLGHNLIQMGLSTSGRIVPFLSRQYGVPSIDLSAFDLDPAVIGLISAETARKYRIVPLSRAGATLTLAMIDPTNVFAIDDIKFITGDNVEPIVATETAVLEAIEQYYPHDSPDADPASREGGAHSSPPDGRSTLALASRGLEELQATLEGTGAVDVAGALQQIDAEALAGAGDVAPVVRLVHVLLLSAIQQGASDIHIEPFEKELRVRYRIDGVLHGIMSPPLTYRDAIASRVKIMAGLDIAEKRLPQDGRIKIRFDEHGTAKEVEFRVSVLPTLFGEKIVMRVLDHAVLRDVTRLGFEAGSLARFEAAIRRPWGMVLATGPTGSGKTSTLYASIARLNTPDTNIMTAEDPVEFNLPGINQVAVRDQIGLSFAAALRSFLRQDPNIIMVGEIRDLETAEIAVKAALTGHLVLSTLHTNDAPGTITRLINMGIEPYLVASSVHLICAQRLVRRICGQCRQPQPLSSAALIQAGYTPQDAAVVQPMKGAGCEQCNRTGYKGRIGLFEVMPISEALRELILAGAPAGELRRRAITDGMITLRASGLLKVADGVTTVDEVIRETVE